VRLAADSAGERPHLVLLHGWALNSRVWDDLVPELAQDATVDCLDLPGHGTRPWNGGFDTLRSLANVLVSDIPPGAILLGWSLGAQVSLQIALDHPARARGLILVAATPRFLRSSDWEYGVEPEVLDAFASNLQTDYDRTVREFLALQVRGDERAQATLRTLRRKVLAAGPPDLRGLAAGLQVLRHTDITDVLGDVRAPALVIAGERDRLTPPEASNALAARLSRSRFHRVHGAAHAPFLSHPAEFLREVRSFLARLEKNKAMGASP
jgi:pimeloyl-[acyl-carrier protein] methyl ester esterase